MPTKILAYLSCLICLFVPNVLSSYLLEHVATKNFLKFETNGDVNVNGSPFAINESHLFHITYIKVPRVTIHCVKGPQNGNYMKVDSTGKVVNGQANSAPGEEIEFHFVPGLLGKDTVKWQRISTAEFLSFDSSGQPFWTNDFNDPNTLMQFVSLTFKRSKPDVVEDLMDDDS